MCHQCHRAPETHPKIYPQAYEGFLKKKKEKEMLDFSNNVQLEQSEEKIIEEARDKQEET